MDLCRQRRPSAKSQEQPEVSPTSAGLLASMSHDIRTPMNGILGMAELLLADDDLSDRHRRRAEVIKRSGETLLRTLDRLIEFSEIDTDISEFKPTSLDLRSVLAGVCDQFRSTYPGKTIDLHVVDELDDHHRVLSDVQKLERLLSALLRSAAALASSPAIRLVVKAAPAVSDSIPARVSVEISASDEVAPETVPLSCADGTCDPSQHVKEIDLHWLTILKLVRLFGADLNMERLQQDLTALRLDFSLPAASALSSGASEPGPCSMSDTPVAFGNRPPRVRDILVAEDDPDMALLIEDLLDEAGFRATIAYDGASVLQMMDRQPFDVVLMDGHLPDMTGFEATQAIRDLPDDRSNTPIIALTGEALPGDRERYLSCGMDDYIAKPVSYETLLETIERATTGMCLSTNKKL